MAVLTPACAFRSPFNLAYEINTLSYSMPVAANQTDSFPTYTVNVMDVRTPLHCTR